MRRHTFHHVTKQRCRLSHQSHSNNEHQRAASRIAYVEPPQFSIDRRRPSVIQVNIGNCVHDLRVERLIRSLESSISAEICIDTAIQGCRRCCLLAANGPGCSSLWKILSISCVFKISKNPSRLTKGLRRLGMAPGRVTQKLLAQGVLIDLIAVTLYSSRRFRDRSDALPGLDI